MISLLVYSYIDRTLPPPILFANKISHLMKSAKFLLTAKFKSKFFRCKIKFVGKKKKC